MPLTFITGPVRSGKSRLALKLARERERQGARVTYVATATLGSGDAEWQARIERHREERDAAWAVRETAAPGGDDLSSLIEGATSHDVLLVDSTGTWLAASIDSLIASSFPVDEATLESQCVSLIDACAKTAAHAILVGDEVGWGIVPESAATRLFRDVLGRLHQRLTVVADRAFLVVAGRAIDLYEYGTPI